MNVLLRCFWSLSLVFWAKPSLKRSWSLCSSLNKHCWPQQERNNLTHWKWCFVHFKQEHQWQKQSIPSIPLPALTGGLKIYHLIYNSSIFTYKLNLFEVVRLNCSFQWWKWHTSHQHVDLSDTYWQKLHKQLVNRPKLDWTDVQFLSFLQWVDEIIQRSFLREEHPLCNSTVQSWENERSVLCFPQHKLNDVFPTKTISWSLHINLRGHILSVHIFSCHTSN